MIVRNRKGENSTVLCDLVGCGRSEKLMVPGRFSWTPKTNPFSWTPKTNPNLRTWRVLGTFELGQLHFCDVHAPVLLDVVFSHVQIAAGAADAVRALHTGDTSTPKIERPAHRPADLGEGSR